jgi:hypothetical protein
MAAQNLLTIDVGITTGYAWYRGDIRCESGAIGLSVLDDGLKQLRAKIPNGVTVVAERTASPQLTGDMATRLAAAERTVEGAFPHVQWIFSAAWKSSPARTAQVPRGVSRHERDAIRIAVWYQRYR